VLLPLAAAFYQSGGGCLFSRIRRAGTGRLRRCTPPGNPGCRAADGSPCLRR